MVDFKQGNQGDQGFQGTQGTQGNQGNQGTQGTQGNQGNQGVIGDSGVDNVLLTSDHATPTTNVLICEPVYVKSNGRIEWADANAQATTEVMGLVADTAIAQNAAGNVKVDGFMTATTGQWDAVTGGSGGLTVGDVYFLSEVAAGRLTTAAPVTVGNFVVRVGRAVSTTVMDVMIEPPIKL